MCSLEFKIESKLMIDNQLDDRNLKYSLSAVTDIIELYIVVKINDNLEFDIIY